MPRLEDMFDDYSPGPKILPRDALIAFFEESDKKTVKIPVVVRRREGSHRLEQVFVGVCDDMEEADKLVLHPDDTALGIGLGSRINAAFGDQRVCHAWLIGTWGPHIDPPPGFGPPEGIYPFAVHDMEVRNDGPKDNADAHVLV